MQTSQQRASIVRERHIKNGGDMTTQGLASLLNISDRTVRKYLAKRLAVDPSYVPPKRSLPTDLIVTLHRLGLSASTIAEYAGVSPNVITYHLKKEVTQ